MSDLVIPTRTDLDNYTEQVTLQGALYTFTFAWNYRSSRWTLSLADSSGVPILSGQPVLVGVDLLRYCSSGAKPPGYLVAVDSENNDQDPGINDLGGRVALLYREA